ncbi:hypothetical protein [Amycolatopsis sp. NPDC051071]|uniref:hypothetical protein n=1 Tax=Amycolatopsis sp. NPDC051071 TaxID=3154637 RepID=UPI003430EB50
MSVAATNCDAPSVIRWSLDQLGEHRVRVRLISPSVMEAETGTADVYGYAEPELLTFSTGIRCRYLAATVAHEVAHVWQYRATGASDLYAALGHDHAEIVADCTAMSTGWMDYRPYLTARQREIGQVGCTGAELTVAAELRRWAR